jgi:hypothetical protein
MRLPPIRQWVPTILLLVGMGLGVAAGIWRKSVVLSNETTTPLERKWWTEERWLTVEEIARKAEEMPEADLRRMFTAGEDTGWLHAVNGNEILQSVLFRLHKLQGAETMARTTFAWIDSGHFSEAHRVNILRVLFGVFAQGQGISPSMWTDLLRGRLIKEIAAALEGYLEVRPQESPEAAVAMAKAVLLALGVMDEANAKSLANQVAIRVWAELDLSAALQFAQKTRYYPLELAPVLRRVRALDPSKIIELTGRFAEGSGAEHSWGNLAYSAGITPAELREGLRIKPSQDWQECLSAYAEIMLARTPEEIPALARAFTAKDAYANWEAGEKSIWKGVGSILHGLADRDPAGAREWIRVLSEEHQRLAVETIWGAYGLGNARVAELSLEYPQLLRDAKLAKQVFQALSYEHLEKGIRALELIPAEQRASMELEMRFNNVVQRFRNDLAGAMKEIDAAPQAIQENLRAKAFESLAEDDPQQALMWLNGHPEYTREYQWKLAVRTPFISDKEWEQAVSSVVRAGDVSETLMGELTRQTELYARTRPQAGVEWLRTLSNSGAQPELASKFSEKWAIHDPQGAAAWIQSLEPGKTRDFATAGMARANFFDADAALTWAEAIGDPGGRIAMIE